MRKKDSSRNIIFTDTLGVSKELQPVPAVSAIPDWYKNSDSYIHGKKEPLGNGQSSATIKRCMPVFDALSHGYFILTHTDVWISQREQEYEGKLQILPWFEWAAFEPILFHPANQVSLYPTESKGNFPKWMNPWSIKTPPGYSTLFISPVHRNNVFTILEGVVDTDTHFASVNFPMYLTNPNFEGLLPAGTPIAQVIPFQREPWKMSLGSEIEKNEAIQGIGKVRSRFFDSYKNLLRQPKEYK
jgi:hypothetical protein